MRIDVPTPESWATVSERFRNLLPFQDPAVQVQLYSGFQHALFEVTHGLARLFSHKKTIAHFAGAEPAIEQLAVSFSEDAFKVIKLTPDDLKDPGKIIGSELPDLIFLVFAEDDPVTGKISDTGLLDEALKDKRVFQIKLSHARHGSEELKRPGQNEVKILSLQGDLALVVGGERFRVSPQLAPKLNWNSLGETKDLSTYLKLKDVSGRKKLILDFESNLNENFRPYFQPSDERLFDRSVIVAKGLDGSAVIDELARINQVSVLGPGANVPFETTSPCRWNHPRFTDWLISRGESEETVRGLIVIDSDFITPKLQGDLSSSAEKILKLQK